MLLGGRSTTMNTLGTVAAHAGVRITDVEF
jgi:hypothetical protein